MDHRAAPFVGRWAREPDRFGRRKHRGMLNFTMNLRMRFKQVVGSLAVLTLLSLSSGCGPVEVPNLITAGWPKKPITISCFAAAGGGTDAVSRLVAKLMKTELGVNVSVVNRTSGRGGAAINYVAVRVRDGYNWGGFSESMLTGSVLGITEATASEWTFFMVAGAPGVISVPADSPYSDLASLVEAAKANPKTIKVSAALTGGIWHTKLLALQEAAGVEFQFIPFNQGSQPSQLAALSGEVDAVLTSVSEQAELIKGKKLRPLAMVEADGFSFPEMGDIPAAAELYPDVTKIPVSQFLGFALPSDTPEPILQRITEAFEKIMTSDEVKQFCEERLLTLQGWHGDEANQRAVAAERAWVWKLDELGITVESPEAFEIPKPE